MSVFTIILTLAMVVLFGAVVDFEQKLEARHDANTVAQEAARAGAGRIDLDGAYIEGTFIVDRGAAIRAARTYLRTGGYTGTVTASGAYAIHVHVTITRPALFLPVIGIDQLRADGTATANLTTGVQGPTRP